MAEARITIRGDHMTEACSYPRCPEQADVRMGPERTPACAGHMKAAIGPIFFDKPNALVEIFRVKEE